MSYFEHCGEWDDTAFQTRDSKFEPWRSEAEHAPHDIESLRVSREETFCVFRTWGSNPQSPTFQAGNFNHYTKVPAPPFFGLKATSDTSQLHYKHT